MTSAEEMFARWQARTDALVAALDDIEERAAWRKERLQVRREAASQLAEARSWLDELIDQTCRELGMDPHQVRRTEAVSRGRDRGRRRRDSYAAQLASDAYWGIGTADFSGRPTTYGGICVR